MVLNNGYHLGMLGSTFILWNAYELINLESKNLQKAIKESEKYIAQKEKML